MYKTMNEIREQEDKKLFNAISKQYARKDIYPVSSYARKFQLLSLIKLYRKKYQKASYGTIIELGCGVGASTKYLDGHFNKYIGVDYSEELIHLAKKYFSTERSEYICANIKEFKNDSKDVDFVFGVGVLHHVSDLDDVLQKMRTIGHSDTIFGFIEPQASSPIIQLMRRIRMFVDKTYSSDQVFFTKNYIRDVFAKNGYQVTAVKYQGYFTPVFAQVIIKPSFVFMPVVAVFTALDRFIQDYVNNLFSWNMIWVAEKKRN